MQQNHSLCQQSFTFCSYCSFESLQQTAVWWCIYSSTVFLELNKQYSSHVPEHGSHHFARWGHNLELSRSRRFFVFPLSSVDSDEPRSHHPLQFSPASPSLLSCSAAGCQEMSSLAWPAVPALAVSAPIEQTPSETWDDCRRFCALNLVKYQCAEQCLKLTRAGWTVWNRQLRQSCHRSSKQHPAESFLINNAFSAASILYTSNVYCWFRKTLVAIHWTYLRVNLICIKSFCPQKRIAACCSLRDNFNGNVAIFNVYKWRHSDVIVIKLTAGTQN